MISIFCYFRGSLRTEYKNKEKIVYFSWQLWTNFRVIINSNYNVNVSGRNICQCEWQKSPCSSLTNFRVNADTEWAVHNAYLSSFCFIVSRVWPHTWKMNAWVPMLPSKIKANREGERRNNDMFHHFVPFYWQQTLSLKLLLASRYMFLVYCWTVSDVWNRG